MSRFYGSLQGSRGEATRQGTRASGITGHIRGWNIGARVDVDATEIVIDGTPLETDRVLVAITGGSNRGGAIEYIADFNAHDIKQVLSGTKKIIPAQIVDN